MPVVPVYPEVQEDCREKAESHMPPRVRRRSENVTQQEGGEIVRSVLIPTLTGAIIHSRSSAG